MPRLFIPFHLVADVVAYTNAPRRGISLTLEDAVSPPCPCPVTELATRSVGYRYLRSLVMVTLFDPDVCLFIHTHSLRNYKCFLIFGYEDNIAKARCFQLYHLLDPGPSKTQLRPRPKENTSVAYDRKLKAGREVLLPLMF